MCFVESRFRTKADLDRFCQGFEWCICNGIEAHVAEAFSYFKIGATGLARHMLQPVVFW